MSKGCKSLKFYPNGNVLAFDENGKQIDDIQNIGWMEHYLDRLGKMGYDPSQISSIKARMNDGEFHELKAFLTSDGQWNYEILPL